MFDKEAKKGLEVTQVGCVGPKVAELWGGFCLLFEFGWTLIHVGTELEIQRINFAMENTLVEF